MPQKSNVELSKSKAIIIPTHWRESIQHLPDKEAAALFRAAFAVSDGDEPEQMRGGAAALWPLLRELILQNQKKYADICEKRKLAAEKRWKNDAKNANECKSMQENAKAIDSIDLQCYTNTNTNTKVSKDTIPPNPPAGELGNGKPVEKWLKRCIGNFYHRRKTTAWSRGDQKKLAEIAARPDVLIECRELMKLYRSTGYSYQRRDVSTLLNNWAGEVDRARNFKQPGNGGKDRTYAGISGQF